MKHWGTVIQVKNTMARVLIDRKTSCSNCNGCIMGKENKNLEIEAINTVNAEIGQLVEVDIEENNFLLAILIAYGIPFIALMGGILIATLILNNLNLNINIEIAAALNGFLLMGLTYLIIRRKEDDLKHSKRYTPIISKIKD